MPMRHDIDLIESEAYQASGVGCHRRIQGMLHSTKNGEHSDHDSYDTDIHGSASELAVAKYLGVTWTGGKPGGADIIYGKTRIQVRCTLEETNRLILREKDLDGDFFVLVIAPRRGFTYSIRGGLYGRDRHLFTKTPASAKGSACWMIPQDKLNFFPTGRKEQPAENGHNREG